MSDGNGDALGAFKANIEQLALAELAKLNDEVEELEAKLEAARVQRRSVKAVLLAARPKQERKKQGSAKVPFVMSEDRRQQFADWLATQEGEFTTHAVKEAFPGWSDSYTNTVVKHMREQGSIRLAAQTGNTRIYKAVA